MKYCKESILVILFGAFLLTTSCSSFGKGGCDRCPEFTQTDEKQINNTKPQSTQDSDAE